MTLDDLIITTYCFVDDFLIENDLLSLRTRGSKPALRDSEVICMEIVGEYLRHNTDAGIWSYFKTHWLHFFPNIGGRTSFSRQSANLIGVKHRLKEHLLKLLSADQDLFLCDGFPLPVCHVKHHKKDSYPFASNLISGAFQS